MARRMPVNYCPPYKPSVFWTDYAQVCTNLSVDRRARMNRAPDATSSCPYCGRPMRWLAGRWFGRGCFECEQCGEFPDLGSPIAIAPATPKNQTMPPRIPAKRDERPRVLLVDDSIEQCDLYALMLEPTASVITASRGEDALTIARKEPLDAIVLDVMMP